MPSIGIHASHEQIAPSALLAATARDGGPGQALDPSRRASAAPPLLPWDLATVEAFDLAATHVRPEDMHGPVLISSDLARHAAWIADFADAGFDAVYLHHVGREQQRFIAAFGEHVLPAL